VPSKFVLENLTEIDGVLEVNRQDGKTKINVHRGSIQVISTEMYLEKAQGPDSVNTVTKLPPP
jgi:hypothetical protein